MCEIINTYYGRPEIPVGCAKDIGKSGAEPEHIKRYGATVKKYAKWAKHLNSNDAPDANAVYRRVLAAQPDHSVVVCSVGFLTNLRRLLETKPDDISPLDGKALVAQKVKLWVAMACKYPSGKEYNSANDPESSRIALENWPTPIVFSDFEYGRDCYAGRTLAESGAKENPVAEVFAGNIPTRDEVRADSAKWNKRCSGMGGRASWDQTAALISVRGWEPYCNAVRGAYRMVGKNGEDEWVPDENSPHLRVTEKRAKAEVAKAIDELMCRRPACAR